MGFNLPLPDLSRLSLGWRPTREGGFALIFSKVWWRKTQRRIANPYRPLIKIEAKDARTAFMSCGSTKRPKEWPNKARLLDVGMLLFSLFDQHQAVWATGAVTFAKRENLNGCTQNWITNLVAASLSKNWATADATFVALRIF